MVDLYEKEEADVVNTPPEKEETIPAKEEPDTPVEEPKEDVQPEERPAEEDLKLNQVVRVIPEELMTKPTTTADIIEEEKVIETKEHDDVEFIVDEIGFNIESVEIPSFDYGYKNPMTAENLEVDMSKLFTGAKPRSGNPTVFMLPGGTRSMKMNLNGQQVISMAWVKVLLSMTNTVISSITRKQDGRMVRH